MNALQQLAKDIDDSIYVLRPAEFMRWGHEDLLDSLKNLLQQPGCVAGASVHCQVSVGSFLKYGPLHMRIKHIVCDYVIVDRARHPIAILDYMGAGHDAGHDAVKQAIARKVGIAYIQVAREWDVAQIKAELSSAFNSPAAVEPAKADAHALQEMLKLQNFDKAA